MIKPEILNNLQTRKKNIPPKVYILDIMNLNWTGYYELNIMDIMIMDNELKETKSLQNVIKKMKIISGQQVNYD